jgi:aryl-alcohol dehydrogenase-like predicted oxidoreductase/enamine deaminase RidA (YjgF/YER057c/UK114 family)
LFKSEKSKTFIGKNNLFMNINIPRVIIGLWQIADIERKNANFNPASVVENMEAYLDAGLNFFDMADHYGSAEIIAGLLYKKRKEEGKSLPVLATKWVPKPGHNSKDIVKDAVTLALNRLQVNQLDLLQFHAWDYTDPSWIETMFYLDELRKEGYIKALGVTNMDTVHLKMAIDSNIPIVSNQISHSLFDQRAVNKMIPYCLENKVRVLCYGTVAGGFFSNKWLGKVEPSIENLPTWSLMKYKRFQEEVCDWKQFQDLLKQLDGISKQLDLSIAQLASLYIKEEFHCNSVIIGARLGELEHITENKQVSNMGLDEESKLEIAHCLKQFNSVNGDCGDEYRYPPFLTASGDLSHHIASFPPAFQVKDEGNSKYSASSGTIWESFAGYSRAVKKGNHVFVSGTTATQGSLVIGGNSPDSQMHFVLDKIEGALKSMNATMRDVVRTRIFVSDVQHWEAIARVHGKRFEGINPTNTLVVAKLIGEEYLVEVEADAILDV